MIKVILWDIDGTLLDFARAEHEALKKCFLRFGMGVCTDEMIAQYSVINQGYWERLERGELSKKEVLEGRFREFFEREGLETGQVSDFNLEYQVRLGDTVYFQDHADKLVQELKGQVKQYAVTNGTRTAQKRKLENSGLNKTLDGAFISDEIGAEKPNPAFFEYVWNRIGFYDPKEVLIVGDSLTSDMLGGMQAGILCCWYNPKGLINQTTIQPDYELNNLWQVKEILHKSTAMEL